MTLFNAIKVNTLLYADGRLLRIIFAFIRFFTPKIKNMEDLDSQLLNLIFEKFDIQNDTAEGAIESLMLATLRLERARVAFLALEPAADFVEVASGLVDLADIFDDEQIELCQVDLFERTMQHNCIKVTISAGVNLNRCPSARCCGTCAG